MSYPYSSLYLAVHWSKLIAQSACVDYQIRAFLSRQRYIRIQVARMPGVDMIDKPTGHTFHFQMPQQSAHDGSARSGYPAPKHTRVGEAVDILLEEAHELEDRANGKRDVYLRRAVEKAILQVHEVADILESLEYQLTEFTSPLVPSCR
jgi:hypothetical protein